MPAWRARADQIRRLVYCAFRYRIKSRGPAELMPSSPFSMGCHGLRNVFASAGHVSASESNYSPATPTEKCIFAVVAATLTVCHVRFCAASLDLVWIVELMGALRHKPGRETS